MATSNPPEADPLLSLRQSIASNKPPVSTRSSSDDPNAAPFPESNLSLATHLQFPHTSKQVSLLLSTPTRFVSSGKPIELLSIYFAWIKKDEAIPDYIAACRKLTEDIAEVRKQRKAEAGAEAEEDTKDPQIVQNLVFAEKLDLITWLEGASDESEFIQPLDEEIAAALKAQEEADGAADIASGAKGGVSAVPGDAAAGQRSATTAATVPRPAKRIDPRLREIYNGERRMGDHNSILRGIKPTDFSHVHKISESFLGRGRSKASASSNGVRAAVDGSATPALVQNRTKPPAASSNANASSSAASSGSNGSSSRQKLPIILLSPSASSLLRMSNIKSFLNDGVFQPSDSLDIANAGTTANILQISRMLPSIDPARPLRFILVDSADQLKPDDWNRVVAVFTTGQLWQFKTYLWQSPPDLFSHALGIYVGWRGEEVPGTVKGWGRGVMSTQIDKYNPHQGVKGRWRDREVVEGIWTAIEESMRAKGWGKDSR